MWKLFAIANALISISGKLCWCCAHKSAILPQAIQLPFRKRPLPPMPKIKLSFLRHCGFSTCHNFVLCNIITTSVITGLCNYHTVTSVQVISALWAISVLVVVLLGFWFFFPLHCFFFFFFLQNFMTISLHCHNQLSRSKNMDLWADSRTVLLIRYMAPCHLEKALQAGMHLNCMHQYNCMSVFNF